MNTTMRERFDEYFEYMSGGYYASRMGRHAVHPDDIKHFIEQELKKEREEIVGMIENQPIEKAHTYGSENAEMYRAYDNGQEQFKKDIINTIKNRV